MFPESKNIHSQIIGRFLWFIFLRNSTLLEHKAIIKPAYNRVVLTRLECRLNQQHMWKEELIVFTIGKRSDPEQSETLQTGMEVWTKFGILKSLMVYRIRTVECGGCEIEWTNTKRILYPNISATISIEVFSYGASGCDALSTRDLRHIRLCMLC